MKTLKNHNRWWQCAKLDSLGFGLVLTVSICLGFAVNALRAEPLPLTYVPPEVALMQAVERIAAADALKAEAEQLTIEPEIGLEEFRELVEQREVLIVDARPEIFHRMGRVPGAMSLPRDDFEVVYPTVRKELGEAKAIVLYCASATCEDSNLLKAALEKLGHTGISIFKGGWAEWRRDGLEEEVSR